MSDSAGPLALGDACDVLVQALRQDWAVFLSTFRQGVFGDADRRYGPRHQVDIVLTGAAEGAAFWAQDPHRRTPRREPAMKGVQRALAMAGRPFDTVRADLVLAFNRATHAQLRRWTSTTPLPAELQPWAVPVHLAGLRWGVADACAAEYPAVTAAAVVDLLWMELLPPGVVLMR